MATDPTRVPRLFRVLLRLLPFEFRSDHGREMSQVFGEERRDIQGGKRRHLAALWLRTIAGMLRVAPAAHLAMLRQDAGYALRTMRRTPTFTLVALTTLGLGIGAATTMFSIVDAVLLRPLPYPTADALVAVQERSLKNPDDRGIGVSYPGFLDLRAGSATLDQAAAYRFGEVVLRGGSEPIREFAAFVSPEVFPLLGARPQIGRTFAADENRADSHVVIIGHALWQRLFSGDTQLSRLTLATGKTSLDVIGVMPAGFMFPTPETDIWLPIGLTAADPAMQDRTVHQISVVARRRAGVSLDAVRAELTTRAGAIVDPGHTLAAVPLAEAVVGPVSGALLTASVAIGLVLLLACVNMAGLLLARASVRRRETVIRSAIGASRWRLVRQHLTESLVLALAGGSAGVLLAWWSLALAHSTLTRMVPRAESIALDGRALAFALFASGATSLVCGLVPAFAGSRPDLSGGLKSGRFGSPRGVRLRGALVVIELALSLILVVGAGLMAKSYWRVVNVDPGFRAGGLVAMRVTLPAARFPDTLSVVRFYRELPARLAVVEGAEIVSGVNVAPISGGDSHGAITVEGRTVLPADAPVASFRRILPNYFRAMQIPVLAGREFDDHDDGQDPKVVIISDAMARRLWPGASPLGQRIKIGPADREPWLTVVGVAGDVRNVGLEDVPAFDTYEPHAQRPWSTMQLLVRARGDASRVGGDVRVALRQGDPDVIVDHLETMASRMSGSELARRFSTLLLATFAGLSLVLAAVSIYGLTAYSVAERTREFGIRIALGATRRDIARAVLGRSLRLGAAGVLMGVLLAVPAVQMARAFLATVDPADPIVYLTVGLVLLGVAVLAPYAPARRAMRVDPNLVLRVE